MVGDDRYHLKTNEVTSQLLNGFKTYLNLKREKKSFNYRNKENEFPPIELFHSI